MIYRRSSRLARDSCIQVSVQRSLPDRQPLALRPPSEAAADDSWSSIRCVAREAPHCLGHVLLGRRDHSRSTRRDRGTRDSGEPPVPDDSFWRALTLKWCVALLLSQAPASVDFLGEWAPAGYCLKHAQDRREGRVARPTALRPDPELVDLAKSAMDGADALDCALLPADVSAGYARGCRVGRGAAEASGGHRERHGEAATRARRPPPHGQGRRQLRWPWSG